MPLESNQSRHRDTKVTTMIDRNSLMRINKQALPLVSGNLSFYVSNIVILFMLGQIGSSAIAAAGIAWSLLGFVMSTVSGFFICSQTMLAKGKAPGHQETYSNNLSHHLLLAMSVGAGLMVLYGPLSLILEGFSLGEETKGLAKTYLMVVVLTLLPFTVNRVLTAVLLVEELSGLIAVISKITVAVNVLLGYVLIFGKLGLPELGLMGAAIATVISRFIETTLSFAAIAWRRPRLLGAAYQNRQFSWSQMSRIIKTGLPTAEANLVETGTWTVFTWLVARLGVSSVAAHEVCMKIKDIALLPAVAYSSVVVAQTSQALAQNDYGGAKNIIKGTAFSAGVLMGIIGVALGLFSEFWMSLFVTDIELIAIGKRILIMMTIYQILDAIFISLRGGLNGLGEAKFVRTVVVMNGWFLMLPFACLLMFPVGLGIDGAWIALIIYLAMSSAFMLMRVREFFKVNQHEETSAFCGEMK